ncbi:MAG TPA: HAD family hydrolase [Firmicutes bacterium]|nr:HAD family hydrolase [Bacillota bacterium]
MVLGSDYDGTLCRDGRISEEDLAAIKRWREAGHLFGVISGRGYSSLYHEVAVRNRVPYDFLIGNNGCVLYDAAGNLLANMAGDGAVLVHIVPAIIEAGGFHACISLLEERIMVDYPGASDRGDVTRAIRLEEVGEIRRFNQIDTRLPSEKAAADFSAMVNRLYGDAITAYQNGTCVDMVPPGVSKPEGFAKYLELQGIEPGEGITIGDNYNDIGMLEAFGGYVVDTAAPEIKARVGRVCASIADLIEMKMGRA